MSVEINVLENPAAAAPSDFKWVARAEKVLQGVVALTILFIMVLTFTDVVMRYVVSSPIKGSAEMVQFAMAVLIFAAFPLVTYHQKHITVSLVHGKLHGVMGWLHRLIILLVNMAICFATALQLAEEGTYLSTNGMSTMVLGWHLGALAYVMSALSAVSGMAALLLVVAHCRDGHHIASGRSA